MRILFITPTFPNLLDPVRGLPNYQTARALARNHQVVVVAHLSWLDETRRRKPGGRLERLRYLDGIEVHHPRYYYPPGAFRTAYGWFLWRSIRSTVMDVLGRFRPDVVLAGWVHPEGDSALRVAAHVKVPCVVWSGGSDVLVLPRDPARRRCIVDVLGRSDAVVCVSDHLKSAISNLGVPDGNIHVVRNGLDGSCFYPADRSSARQRLGLPLEGTMLLWVGRMVPIKGVDVLIDACGALTIGGLDIRLCLVGDGPLRRVLAARTAQAGLDGRVMFIGDVSQETLADWYRAADLTVLPSHSEGVPNVLCESISCGTPFVASNVGGIPEIADSQLDRLVAPGDALGLARVIRERLLLERAPARARLPGTWEDHALKMEAVFARAIATRAQAVHVARHN